jgi:hypothetical protein
VFWLLWLWLLQRVVALTESELVKARPLEISELLLLKIQEIITYLNKRAFVNQRCGMVVEKIRDA